MMMVPWMSIITPLVYVDEALSWFQAAASITPWMLDWVIADTS
jgi:hypothetical protein